MAVGVRTSYVLQTMKWLQLRGNMTKPLQPLQLKGSTRMQYASMDPTFKSELMRLKSRCFGRDYGGKGHSRIDKVHGGEANSKGWRGRRRTDADGLKKDNEGGKKRNSSGSASTRRDSEVSPKPSRSINRLSVLGKAT